MRQWSELLLAEIVQWPQVTTRPMFGMTAVYHGNAIFGVLPRTRAMESACSVSFKLPRHKPQLAKALAGDKRILLPREGARWISFELRDGRDIADALAWFRRAYDAAAPSEVRHAA